MKWLKPFRTRCIYVPSEQGIGYLPDADTEHHRRGLALQYMTYDVHLSLAIPSYPGTALSDMLPPLE